MSEAAVRAGVRIVTGDTKVVGKDAADGVYISTTGVGVIPEGRRLSPDHVRPGDKVLLSGTIGEHGMAVMLARGDLAIDADIASDTAPVNALVEVLLEAAPSTRWMRDATRGGVGTVCNELAKSRPFAVILDEQAFPVQPQVLGASDMLGIDPLYIANEGKFVAIVAAEEADAAIAAMREHPQGRTPRSSARSCRNRRASSRCELRSAAAESWTCSSATRCRGSARDFGKENRDVSGNTRSGGRHRRRRTASGQGGRQRRA